jgi:steroid delta-isomerase-like uncharacterized protein
VLALTICGWASGAATSKGTTTNLLDEWAQAWNAHDIPALTSLYRPDGIYEDAAFGSQAHGAAEIKNFAAATLTGIPDFKLTVTNRSLRATSGHIEWVMSGTQVGAFPGLPATGKMFHVRGATILVIKNGKIARSTDYWDAVTLMREVGLHTVAPIS